MLYRILADAVVVIHAAFILFVVLGGWLVWRFRWIAALHLPAAVWGAYIEFSHGICPLTPLENQLRQRAGESGYAGGFIDHYFLSALYPEGLTPATQNLLGLAVAVINIAAYVFAHWYVRSARAHPVPPRQP